MRAMSRFSRFTTSRGLALVILVALLVFLAFSAALKDRVDEMAAWTIHFATDFPVLGAVIFVVFGGISAMLAFASSAVLVPPATVVWGKLGTFLLLWVGWTLGAAAAWGIGRSLTPLLFRLGYGRKLVKYQQMVSKEMAFWAVVAFCVAVPSEVPGYLFGSAHYRFWKFIAAVSLAESVYAFALVILGESLVVLKPSHVLIVGSVIVLLALFVVPAIRERKGKAENVGK